MRRGSITRRLTLLFAGILSAGFLGLGIYLYSAIDHHFKEIDRTRLDSAMQRVELALEGQNDADALRSLHARLDSMMVGQDRVALRFAIGDGVVLATDAKIVFPEEATRAAMSRAAPGRPVLFTWDQGEHQYRGLAARLALDDNAELLLQVTAALNIDHHKAFMAVVLRALWVSIACAIAVAALVSVLIARSGLRPLRLLASQMDAISSHRLNQRLSTDGLPVELIGFAEAFNAMLARLDASFARLSEFSADIAHELRTPVSNLLTQTQVTLSKQRSVEEYRDVLASNIEELERLSRMVSDMLFLAKTDNRQELAVREPIDVANEVKELFEFYEALAAEKSIALNLNGNLSLRGDRAMLRRALNNLLSNAIRYTPAGGSVNVALETIGSRAFVRVINPGDPIPEATRERLFERFYRADAARSRDTEGAGLGLAIVKAIAETHGGGVDVSSSQNCNTFTIWFNVDVA
ncbi:MAG: heavy metal sensor histidine kinase [Betaproteobacteria bacterium]|nr:MAG: heavy metal sensor histidine kinase [Betaproteobacteria bacterium]